MVGQLKNGLYVEIVDFIHKFKHMNFHQFWRGAINVNKDVTKQHPNKKERVVSLSLDVNDVTLFKHKEIHYLNNLSHWIIESPFCE